MEFDWLETTHPINQSIMNSTFPQILIYQLFKKCLNLSLFSYGWDKYWIKFYLLLKTMFWFCNLYSCVCVRVYYYLEKIKVIIIKINCKYLLHSFQPKKWLSNICCSVFLISNLEKIIQILSRRRRLSGGSKAQAPHEISHV